MGYIGMIVAIIGILITILTLFKHKKAEGDPIPKLLFAGIALVVVGAILTMINI